MSDGLYAEQPGLPDPDLGDAVRNLGRAGGWRRDLAFLFASRYRVVWTAVAILLVVCAASASELFGEQSLLFISALAGVLAIAAAGQLLVVMSGGIDVSVAGVITLTGAIVVKQSQSQDGRLAGAILIALALGLAVGLVNGLLVSIVRLNALIVTLAVGGIVGGATILWAGTQFSASGEVPQALSTFTAHRAGFFSVVAAIGLGLLLLLGLGLRNTAVGRAYVATGTNPVAAEIIGIRVRAYQVGGYALAGVLYAAAGILLAGLLKTPDATLGAPYLLSTIIAVALGGASLAGGPASMACTAAGCFFVVLLNQFLAIENFPAGVKELADGIALVLAVALVTVGADRRFRLGDLRARLLRLRPGEAPDDRPRPTARG